MRCGKLAVKRTGEEGGLAVSNVTSVYHKHVLVMQRLSQRDTKHVNSRNPGGWNGV